MEVIKCNVFKNVKKKASQPDFSGVTKDQKVRVAIWENKTKTGKNIGATYYSVQISDNKQSSESAFE